MSDLSAIEFTRWYLAIFFVGVGAFYTTRILLLKRRLHESPVFMGSPGTLHFTTHLTFRVFRTLILGVCVARLVWPTVDSVLVPFESLWHPAVLLIGNLLLALGFAAALKVHFFMGDAWRSGTRPENKKLLITSGPFSATRNPMMVCVMTTQLGLFLAMPSAFTLICLLIGVWAVRTQVLVEEKLLHQRFGAAYAEYAGRVPRWLIRP